jgi:hypothetical protein
MTRGHDRAIEIVLCYPPQWCPREDEPLVDQDRLPPPPFWRTRHFALTVMAERPFLDPIEIQRIMDRPIRRVRQANGRIRLWGYVDDLGAYLSVVLLSDGETVHTAYIDDSFVP